MRYRDKQYRVLFVSAGLDGDTFMTFYYKPSGSMKRFVARGNALPPRKTRGEAQADLDAYAKARGLEVVVNG